MGGSRRLAASGDDSGQHGEDKRVKTYPFWDGNPKSLHTRAILQQTWEHDADGGAFAEFKRYKHNDMEDLERVLSKIPKDKGKLIVSDGVFSTTGEIVHLPRMVELAAEFDARVMIDDAHSVGVIGVGGRGTGSFYGIMDKVDITMGTFSKTFASLGGFMAASERVINYVKHHSPALIFSASPTPASVAGAMAALEILE